MRVLQRLKFYALRVSASAVLNLLLESVPPSLFQSHLLAKVTKPDRYIRPECPPAPFTISTAKAIALAGLPAYARYILYSISKQLVYEARWLDLPDIATTLKGL